ncbi:O-methyltransferase [Fibrella sp. HMF5335]|uniref:O-methyltransferase n=1 Tax=Fibrella rubiginis TaxID=2817060 RepID=A0A939GKI3_9BACT|nr:O-methyltransferase [Fibrella rubiginis]MBO0938939.1 O-methyltransferase [Fibrella rubiginis]
MDFLPADLAAYADVHTTSESDTLRRLNRDTHAHVLWPRMLSGHVQGRLLAFISQMVRPRRILEIGTYTGYSALCLAEGLTPDGRLITIDKNEELETMARQYWAESPYAHQIDLRVGNAPDVIKTLTDEVFDLVFIDADKENYALYYDMIFDHVRSGGFIMADNVLWSGKVIDPTQAGDPVTQAVMAFNQKIHDDPRVENILLPVRDGIMIARKR